MAFSREYPDRPVMGVGGVIIDRSRTVLIRRGTEPLLGEWSIPGGTVEIGESLEEAVRRELREETGLEVRVLDLVELFDRIYFGDGSASTSPTICANLLAANHAPGAMSPILLLPGKRNSRDFI